MGNSHRAAVEEILAMCDDADQFGIRTIHKATIRAIIAKHLQTPERVTEVEGIVRTVGQAASGEGT